MMEAYRQALEDVLEHGYDTDDRTGTGTRELFGLQMRFPYVGHNFPLLTGKKTHWPSILHELLWFIRGGTNIEYLKDNGVTIWDEWADGKGDLGPIYGHQWRAFGAPTDMPWDGVDQLNDLVDNLQQNPYSRRHIVSAWNPVDIYDMALPPCHMMFQCNVTPEGRLDLMMTQRSADMFLGVPFNIASYATLMYILGYLTRLNPGHLTINLGSAHIYKNHKDQVKELLRRDWPEGPELWLRPETKRRTLESFVADDFLIVGYKPLRAIKADVAV